MQRFGEKLRILRKQRGITMKELSQMLGFASYTYLNAIELGNKKPSLELAVEIARFFDVSTDLLLKDELELD